MNKQKIAGFYVAGFAVRTSNAAESSEHGKIPQLWSRFHSSAAMRSISNKSGDQIYSVYTEYESDHTGRYTCVLGYKVSSVANLSNEFTVIQIPEGEYAVVTSDKGPVLQVVPAIWQKIWSLTPDDLQGARAYKTDFELYDRRAANPADAQIDVLLSLQASAS